MTISKGASAEAICPPPMITVKKREQTQLRIPSYLIDNLFRQRLPFKEALVNFASLMQLRGWRLLSRTTKQNTNVGGLDVAAVRRDLASGSQWRVRSQWGLGERDDILRFTRQCLFRFRVCIHHYFRTRVGGNAAGKSDRQQTDHCDFKPSIHRETVPYLRTEEFSSPRRRQDSCCEKASK